MDATPTYQCVVTHQAQLGITDDGRNVGLLVKSVCQIHQQVAIAVALEGIAMQAGAQRCGEFGLDVVVGQVDSVVARACLFRSPVVARAVTAAWMTGAAVCQLRLVTRCGVIARVIVLVVRQAATACLQHHGALGRHHQHIEHVAVARATEMGVGEAHDRAIALVITRTGIPADIVRVGAELHHAERHRCTGIRMTVSTGTDEHINIARYPFAGRRKSIGLSSGNRRPSQSAGERGQRATEHGKGADALKKLATSHGHAAFSDVGCGSLWIKTLV
jgi:hypothetical protein